MSDSLEEFAAQADHIKDLQQANIRLMRKLEQNRLSKEELVSAVYTAVRDGISSLDFAGVPAPPKDARRKGEEVAVAVLSDWQLAKVTPNYNSQVCEARIAQYGDKVRELVNIQRADHPVKELRVWVLGDIVEGELIFPGQSHLIDASLYRQVTIDGPRIFGNFLRSMLSEFEKIHVTAVIGNHGALGGRSRRDYDPETNADRMLYRIMEQLFAGEPRITWNIPDGPREKNWYAIDYIGDYGTLLFHGDQMRGSSGLPWYGFYKKLLGWKSGAIPEPFNDAYCGHWHQCTQMTVNTFQCRVSGSPESYNTYAQEQMAAMGKPSQPLLFVKPSKGITAEYQVWLD